MENQLPPGWTELLLSETGEWLGGGTPSKSNTAYWNGTIPWVSPKDMKKVSIEDTEDFITPAAVEESSVKLIPERAVLFVTRSGILAHSFPVATTKKRVTVNQDLKAIVPLPAIDPEFLAWYLRANSRAILNSCTKYGTTVHSIEMPSLKSWAIAVPPVNEQRRIVAKIEALFSELDKGIEALRTAREQLKVYRQAVLKHAFEGRLTAQWREENKGRLESPGQLFARIQQEREARYQEQLKQWEIAVQKWEKKGGQGRNPTRPKKNKPFPELNKEEIDVLPRLPREWGYTRLAGIAYIGSGMSVSKSRKLNDPIEVPYLRVANVQRGALVLDDIKTMSIEKDMLPELALEKWDVLFNEGGDRDKLGRGWIWEGQVDPCITQNHVFRASPYLRNEFHSKFISHWGNTFGRDYFEKGGKQTTNLASINKTVLSMFPVPVPSLEEQEKIIEYIDNAMSVIDSFECEIERGLAKSETLRQSILKKAFSGQLVPQDPNDEPASVLLDRIRAEKAGADNDNRRHSRVRRGLKSKKAS